MKEPNTGTTSHLSLIKTCLPACLPAHPVARQRQLHSGLGCRLPSLGARLLGTHAANRHLASSSPCLYLESGAYCRGRTSMMISVEIYCKSGEVLFP
jgi:hypothetical protein